MTDRYTDNWGEEARRDNPRDWSQWPLWAAWATEYDWRPGENFAEQDVIVWRENIITNRNARAPDKPPDWVRTGERLVIAHIRQFGGQPTDWVYLVVIHSEGDAPLRRDDKIKRRVKNILRNGVRRWPRNGRAAADETCRDFQRPPDAPVNAPEGEPSPRRGPEQSRFLQHWKMPKPGKGGP